MLFFVGACKTSQPIKSFDIYAEAADPAVGIEADWDGVEPGLQGAAGSIDEHYFKSAAPQMPAKRLWSGTAWRGEKVSAQVVLWSAEPVEQVECEFSEFMGENGTRMPASIAQARFVRYVLTDEFAGGCGYRKPEDFEVHLYPDGLDNAACFDIEGQTTRPVWVTIEVPEDAEAGIYLATLKVTAGGRQMQSFEFILDVLPRVLPASTEWEFHLDLWQNPYAVARVHEVEPWSAEHWEALQPIMQMLADAGQKVITASINKKPWAGQTYDPFDSMIEWRKQADGVWVFDYTVFDNWVEFMMGLGIKKQINCYSLQPWNSQVCYFDEAAGKEVMVKVEPGTSEYEDIWTPFLRDFREHLEAKGWNRITNIAMDERGEKATRAIIELVAEEAPELGIAVADNKKIYQVYPEYIKDLSVGYGAVIDEKDLALRKAKDFVSTYYVCCSDRFPNTFTFSAPAEAVFIGWYATAAGFDGLLRWSYCSWVEDPLHDSRFRTWPAGDTYLVYPDARSSIRFERLVEGIQDAEKIRILREEFEQAGTDEAQDKLQRLNETVALFNVLKVPADTEGLLNYGKRVLEELSR